MIKTNQFFEDFEQRSKSKSFASYWDKISELNNRFDVSEFSEKNVNVNEKIIPKFIEEFEKKIKNKTVLDGELAVLFLKSAICRVEFR